MSDKDEDLWKDGVAAGLRKLRDVLDRIERGEASADEIEDTAAHLEEAAKRLRK